VRLNEQEREKLLVYVASQLALERLSRGVRLNYPETVALISHHVFEGAREGKSVSELMESGRHLIRQEDVMTYVPEMLKDIQIEATFPDGTKLVTIHKPLQ
jgi:urease subunit gamma